MLFSHLECCFAYVEWEPYGPPGRVGQSVLFNVNYKCFEDAHLWHFKGPMICVYAVEYHLPDRVMRQFGLFQVTPPSYKDTRIDLHG
jgi:hypothetical protein